jgi:3-oxoacid CoA-transferase B subunit
VRDQIARRAARLIRERWVVNLGIGIPVLISKYLDPDAVFLQTENGLLGVGPPPGPGELDPNLIDASKLPVTVRQGASFFDSAASFGMLRGGHVDASVLGALQVDERGTVANWAAPGEPVLGVGGAMDILVGVRTVIVAMSHVQRDGAPKLVTRCTLPVTAERPADWIVTELATFRREGGGLVLKEIAPGVTLDEVRARTQARFGVALSGNQKELVCRAG